MERSTTKFLSTFFLIAILSYDVNAQTNVSGTISTNTTWTLVGSPYIVLDSVMIDAGVKLTIQPGVTVKFADGAWLYTNSSFNNTASIIASGTSTDSITFTSNSLSPVPGIYVGIQLNGGYDSSSIFAYCNFCYANNAIFDNQGGMDLLTIKNSNFNFNNYGLKDNSRIIYIDSCNFKYNICGLYTLRNSTIENSTVSNNQFGFDGNINGGSNSIKNCIVDSNQIGLRSLDDYTTITDCKIRYNQFGIESFNNGYHNLMKTSQIDSNIVAGIIIRGGISIDSCQIKYNGIGIIDSGGIYPNTIMKNKIENNYLGIRLGALNDDFHCNKICNNTSYDLKFMTSGNIDMARNYWCTLDSASTQAVIFDGNDSSGLGFANFMPLDTTYPVCFSCYNYSVPYVSTYANLQLQNGSATAYPINGFPPYTYSWNTIPIQTTQTATGLAVGTYTVCVTDSIGCVACANVYVWDSATMHINEIHPDNLFSIFPNPASDQLTVVLKTNPSNAEIKIFNVLGELEYSTSEVKSQTEINISNLASGIYFIQIASENNISRQKFLKK